jgi:hypothetical protein
MKLKVALMTFGIAAAALVPAYPALGDNAGNQPPGPPANNFPNEENSRSPIIDTFVNHCQAFNQGSGTIVFTPGIPGRHTGRVNNNCH